MKILLIAGGWSNEREVSLNGARIVEQTLRERGHSVTFFDLFTEFDHLLRKAKEHDFAFINLHGAAGIDFGELLDKPIALGTERQKPDNKSRSGRRRYF
jgi:D-alanine-D-alanine ligase-like ATP-grasp enzyme